jgi:hypothetical protein
MTENVKCPRCKIHESTVSEGGFCPLCQGYKRVSKELSAAYFLSLPGWNDCIILRMQFERVKYPLCSNMSFDKGVYEIPVSPNTYVFGHRGVMISNATWRKRPLYLRCPLCAGRGAITRELAAAWVLIDSEEYALPTYSETLRVRRQIAPRSRLTSQYTKKAR